MSHWDKSPDWDEARRSGYEPIARAEVWLDHEWRETLEITGGTITVDESNKVRRSLQLPTSDVHLDPRLATDLLAPFGTEIRMYSGMRYSGTEELLPVGVFSIESTRRSGWYDELELTCVDRGGVLSEARFLQPWNTFAGTSVVEEIAAMVLAVLPDAEIYDLTGSDAVTRAAAWGRDRWEAIDNLAKGIGAEVFFDQDGRCVIRDVPTVAALEEFGQQSADVHANRENSDLLGVSHSMSRADVYNAVVASSDQDIPVSAIAYQAAGPLRYRPGFQKPRFFSTPVVTTWNGIAKAATSLLATSIAFSQQIGFETIPDASLDVGSLVSLVEPDEAKSRRILSQFTLPLGSGGMSVQTRIDADVALLAEGETLD
jgi:hypothetical protein